MIDLLYFSYGADSPENWELGRSEPLSKDLKELSSKINHWLKSTKADFVLFWDAALGPLPSAGLLMKLTGSSIDVWHAGLKLGMGGLPRAIDFVEPVWMFNRDAEINQEASSWRLSLRACLIRTEVLRQMGNLDAQFDTLAGAGLSWGCTLLRRGVFVRYFPGLIQGNEPESAPPLSVYDELRFVHHQYGRKWMIWAAWRASMNGYPVFQIVRSVTRLLRNPPSVLPKPYKHNLIPTLNFKPEDWHNKITVLIPTLERYPYLRNELKQLIHQTVRPLEIMIVDQTPEAERETGIEKEFPGLPIRISHQNIQGQCTAWNELLLNSKGEYLLFLGDDADQIQPDFLENFLRTFCALKPDMVASAVEEKGAGPLAESNTYMRTSDIFPICMIRREMLKKSGLMDYAFDKGSRADADLAMRCMLKGAFMVLDPDIRILHLKAPRGGLRHHKARVVTFASSRKSIFQRDLPSVTEIYLAKRYFNPKQFKEMICQRYFRMFAVQGNFLKRTAKIITSLFMLPQSIFEMNKRIKSAAEMFEIYPKIPGYKYV